ncbi:MAG: hypothetical protein ACI9BW_002427 [Gammaproteobacteria bacterium]|jgi:hypothetical protein
MIYSCWKCHQELQELLLPLSRTEECYACGVDLHVCRMCRFYDRSVGNACREPIADFVSNKTRANFCGYLEIQVVLLEPDSNLDQAGVPGDLNSLFGLDAESKTDSDLAKSLQDLFGLDSKPD